MRRRLALAAAAALLGGCAPHFDIRGAEWTKPDAQLQQVTQDEMECARVASRSYWTPETFVGGVADAVRAKVDDAQMTDAFAECMESRGYRPARS